MSAYQQLESIFKKTHHLNHLHAIVSWDEAVMMPPGGGDARAEALGTLSSISHETITQPQTADWLEQANQDNSLNNWQKANLKWMAKKYKNATCIPAELVRQITQASITCEQAWRQMKADNNWKDFAPLLEKTLNLVKESAAIRADSFKQSPYDILIDDFSSEINQAIIDPIFTELKATLPAITQQAQERQKQISIIKPTGKFPIDKQRELSKALMQAIGFDFNRGRLDVSHHPFCGGVSEDVRITTRYNENEFISSAMAICHETGHARYEQDLPTEWLHQPVGQIHSMALHESQSLLIEMQACRSREFMDFLAPLAQQFFGEQEAINPDNLYHLYTHVKPDFIRVDADELTYPLHVILRYELEKQLIEGNLLVKELPAAWNELMQKYLGINPKDNYALGVMQDVHWPSGAFGYFPAYTLGAIIAAQLFAKAKIEYPDIPQQLAQGNFSHLYEWLKNNVHSKASSLSTQELLTQATGNPLSAENYLQHIQKRYID